MNIKKRYFSPEKQPTQFIITINTYTQAGLYLTKRLTHTG